MRRIISITGFDIFLFIELPRNGNCLPDITIRIKEDSSHYHLDLSMHAFAKLFGLRDELNKFFDGYKINFTEYQLDGCTRAVLGTFPSRGVILCPQAVYPTCIFVSKGAFSSICHAYPTISAYLCFLSNQLDEVRYIFNLFLNLIKKEDSIDIARNKILNSGNYQPYSMIQTEIFGTCMEILLFAKSVQDVVEIWES